MTHMVVGVLCAVLCFCTVACRERRYIGPEALIFDAVQTESTMVQQTIQGEVQCTTCNYDTSSMIIELWNLDGFDLAALDMKPYSHVGTYTVSGRVPYGALLEVRAQIFTDGGIRNLKKQVRATDDTSLDAAVLHVPLSFDTPIVPVVPPALP